LFISFTHEVLSDETNFVESVKYLSNMLKEFSISE
jgi:hypothetical protein